MIRVSLKKEGNDLRLTLCGHANYAPRGEDIVCAAASGIVYALMGYLLNFGKNDFKINAAMEGYADLLCAERYTDILKLVVLGLVQLEATYPGYISVDTGVLNWRIRRSA